MHPYFFFKSKASGTIYKHDMSHLLFWGGRQAGECFFNCTTDYLQFCFRWNILDTRLLLLSCIIRVRNLSGYPCPVICVPLLVNELISEYPTIRTVSDYFWGFRNRCYVIKYISEPIRIRLSIWQIFDFRRTFLKVWNFTKSISTVSPKANCLFSTLCPHEE